MKFNRCRVNFNGIWHVWPIKVPVVMGTLLQWLSRRHFRDRQQWHHADGCRFQRTFTHDPASGDGQKPFNNNTNNWCTYFNSSQQERLASGHPDRSGKEKTVMAPDILEFSPPTFFFYSVTQKRRKTLCSWGNCRRWLTLSRDKVSLPPPPSYIFIPDNSEASREISAMLFSWSERKTLGNNPPFFSLCVCVPGGSISTESFWLRGGNRPLGGIARRLVYPPSAVVFQSKKEKGYVWWNDPPPRPSGWRDVTNGNGIKYVIVNCFFFLKNVNRYFIKNNQPYRWLQG